MNKEVSSLIHKEYDSVFQNLINFYYNSYGEWVVEFIADTEEYGTVFYVVQGEHKIIEEEIYGNTFDSSEAFLSHVKDLVKSF